MSLSSRIKERREELGLTRIELADRIGVTSSAIANYENGISSPKVELLYKLFDALDCDANYLYQDEIDALGGSETRLKYEEKKLIEKYRSADLFGKETVLYILDREVRRTRAFTELKAPTQKIVGIEECRERLFDRTIEYFHSVSAGDGVFVMGDEGVEQVLIPTTIPGADIGDYAIKISGDSMEPDFHDGEVALVARMIPVKYGDVGIFIVDGKAYIKEYGKTELISRNPEVENIKIAEYANIVCMGKVVGKVREEDMVRE